MRHHHHHRHYLSLTCRFSLLFFVLTTPAQALVLPTFDIAQLTAAISDYIVQADQLTTQAKSLSTEVKQLSAFKNQADHIIKNLKSLKNIATLSDSEEWTAALRDTMSFFEQTRLLDPSRESYVETRDALIRLRYYVDDSTGHLKAFDEPSRAVKAQQALDTFKDEMAHYHRKNTESKQRQLLIQEYDKNLRSLGDDSGLATLQLGVAQKTLELKQNEDIANSLAEINFKLSQQRMEREDLINRQEAKSQRLKALRRQYGCLACEQYLRWGL